MERTRVMHQDLPLRRQLVIAVWAAMPLLANAQTASTHEARPGTTVLRPVIEPGATQSTPGSTRIDAEKIDGVDQVRLNATNNVRLQRDNLLLNSDRLLFDQVSNEVFAEGNVKLKRGDDEIEGPKARVNLDTLFGEFETPSYVLQRQKKVPGASVEDRRTGRNDRSVTQVVRGTGQADQLMLEGENQYRMKNATYTTCPAPDPSWYLRMSDLDLDFDRDKGEATHSSLVFKGVPIAYAPWMDFPLSGGRQSGILPPTIGATSNTGFDAYLPYYFNLAPNYDATFAPRWMSTRGLQLAGEGRYLTGGSTGTLKAEVLPEDKEDKTSRSLASWRHNQNLGNGFTADVDATRVSDRAYFDDLSSRVTATSQSTLLQQATLGYNSGSWLSGNLLVQRYQVLEGASPYNRQPSLSLTARQPDFHGFAFTLPMEYTSFSHSTPVPGTTQTQPDGRRTVAYPQVSYPMESSSSFVIPKMGLHATRYNVDRTTTDGQAAMRRQVPIMSLDSGLIFERDTQIGDTAQVQTLEPRLYYVKAAYRDQTEIPVFDTAKADFNFAQIFSENTYSGNDRIADSNQLTAGVQSRMIDASSGEEWLRAALAQRYYFADQRVSLPGETLRTGSTANLLGGVAGRVHSDLWAETVLQYDPRVGLWERAVTGLRYQPGLSKALAASYRYQRDQFRSFDVSGQWPLWGGWYGVGRYDRNLRDHRTSEIIAGLEYKADCWVFRTVWQSLVTNEKEKNTSIFLQIEFNGLASVGSNPVNLLKRSVSGYGKINDPGVGDPKFGD
ncbi:LPS-assembly protein LptD [Uliginosibacterium aquaticum]|uniref:LPS-assembly protein LptD n=1 Tax=Uliginosibacterium aquaticum TaxID=2731212 RepID=A0ABX2IC07_9RHOO|nr:LPS-assembly protein LptD [Uliginosibacterium aquaticum]NSL54020.1 LPS-assembly protein LptD [Uliginosibacterium aquaticum]